MEEKKEYVPPQLTVVSFKTEKGFALSSPSNEQLLFWETEQSEQVESYTEHSVWNNGDGFWN